MGSQRVGHDWVTDSFIHLGEKLLNVLNRCIFSFEGFPCVALNKYQSKQNFLKKVHYDSRVLGWAHSFSPWTSIVLTKCLVDKWPLWIAWSWWWTAWPGVLQCMRSQRVGYDWATELNWTELKRAMANSHGIQSHHFRANRWGNNGNSERLYCFGLQSHCRWWLQPWN